MKRLLLGLGVAIAMTLAGNAWAQVPPDVPPGHWAYDAIEELVAEGIIKGYPDGTFKGRAPLTRYEFAIAIRDALAAIQQRIDEVRAQIPRDQRPGEPPRQQGEVFTREEKEKLGRIPADTAERLQRLEEAINRINRLATEFQDELASLGVDV
ncbi:MAG: S-layer homology domain-containing protein, partial [Armatimonadetes bacterium]|nr:S-layer homology domain-containing protein [Armatimonadota bacterium]